MNLARTKAWKNSNFMMQVSSAIAVDNLPPLPFPVPSSRLHNPRRVGGMGKGGGVPLFCSELSLSLLPHQGQQDGAWQGNLKGVCSRVLQRRSDKMIIIFSPVDFQSRRNRQEKIIILARRSCQPGQYRNCVSYGKKRWLAIPLEDRGDGRRMKKIILKIFFGKVLTCGMA